MGLIRVLWVIILWSFVSSATSLFAKTEISTFLREVEINRAVSGNSNISLVIESTGDQNLVKIAHNGATYNLAYLDPDINGKLIYSNLNFIEASSSEIDEILQVVTDANFKKANNTIVYNKKFTLVKTHSGLIKVVDGVVSEAGDLLTSFKNATGINAIKTTDNVLLNKVKSWQGSGSYPGIDDWEIFEIPAGTKLYGGLPGQSEFYSVEKSLIDANYNKISYWNSLQVSPHPQFGYRLQVGEYTVNSTIKVAVSKTLANPQHGSGGAWQVFVDDFADKVTFVKEITLQ